MLTSLCADALLMMLMYPSWLCLFKIIVVRTVAQVVATAAAAVIVVVVVSFLSLLFIVNSKH